MVYIAKFLLPVVMFMGLLPIQAQAQKNTSFMPGEVWKDTDGNPINAHGGECFIMRALTIGTESIKKEKRYYRNGLHGNAIVQM